MVQRLPKDNLFFGLGPSLTDEQRNFINQGLEKDIVFCNSCPGSGKTTLAVAIGRYLVDMKLAKGVIYIFSPVQEKRMGYRPGNQKEKDEAYLLPVKDAISKIGYQPDELFKDFGWIRAESHTFMRGANLEDHVVIIDEAQNCTKDELRKTLTRIHTSCKTFVIGHSGQIDLPKKSMSGFKPYIKHFAGQEKAAVVQLTHDFRGWLSKHADAIDASKDNHLVAFLKNILNKFYKSSKGPSRPSKPIKEATLR